MRHIRSIAAHLLPFAAVLIGLYALHSAWWTLLLYHLGMLAFLGGRNLRSLSRDLSRGWRSGIGLGLVLVCAAGVWLILPLWPAAAKDAPGFDALLGRLGLSGASWIIFAVYYSTLHPLLEELYWRGLLGRGRPIARPSWGDLAFGGYHLLVLGYFLHWPWLGLAFLSLAGAGWIWRALCRRYGGLAIPAVSHLVADAATILLIQYLRGASWS